MATNKSKINCKCGKPILNVPEHLSDVVDWHCRDCAAGPERVHVPKRHVCDRCGLGAPDVAFPTAGLGGWRRTCLTCKPRIRPGRVPKDDVLAKLNQLIGTGG